jgi:hypothetical protein
MLTCDAPRWVLKVFEFLELDMITQETVNDAMNWLLSKSIIICNEVI